MILCYAYMVLMVPVWSIFIPGVISDLSRYYPPCTGCCSASNSVVNKASNEEKLGLMMHDTYNDRGWCSMDYAVKRAPDGASSCHKVQIPGKTSYGA